MDYHLSKQAIETGATYVNSKLNNVNYGRIRSYFDINNNILINKICLMLCPFLHKESKYDSTGLYAPDLYLPSMALITLVLFNGFILGIHNKFHPELLYLSFTRTIIIHCIVNLIYKLIGYVFDIHINYGDMLSYTGYRFFFVFIIRVMKLTLIGKILSVYIFVAFFFFFSRSIKGMFIRDSASKRSIYVLFFIVIAEVGIAFFMSY